MNHCKNCITLAICNSKVLNYISTLDKNYKNIKYLKQIEHFPYALYLAYGKIIYTQCENTLPPMEKETIGKSKIVSPILPLHKQFENVIQYMENNFNLKVNKFLLRQDLQYVFKHSYRSQTRDLYMDTPINILQLLGTYIPSDIEYILERREELLPSLILHTKGKKDRQRINEWWD